MNPWGDKRICKVWNPPVQGEKMEVVSFGEYARQVFGKEFDLPFFDNYYTGLRAIRSSVAARVLGHVCIRVCVVCAHTYVAEICRYRVF